MLFPHVHTRTHIRVASLLAFPTDVAYSTLPSFLSYPRSVFHRVGQFPFPGLNLPAPSPPPTVRLPAVFWALYFHSNQVFLFIALQKYIYMCVCVPGRFEFPEMMFLWSLLFIFSLRIFHPMTEWLRGNCVILSLFLKSFHILTKLASQWPCSWILQLTTTKRTHCTHIWF